MTVTAEVAQDQAEEARARVEQTVSALSKRADPGALLSEAMAWATRRLEEAQDVVTQLSGNTVTLAKQNPIKTAAVGAALAAAGVAIGLFATRERA